MKLQLREHPQPAPSLLEALWSFVSGRMDVEAFEISVYDHLDGLEALLASDTAEQLLALNYATVDADVLRRTIKQAIEGIPTSCECVKIPPAVVLDTGFLARIDGAGELIEYVDGQVLRPFSPVRTDEALSGSWQHRGPSASVPRCTSTRVASSAATAARPDGSRCSTSRRSPICSWSCRRRRPTRRRRMSSSSGCRRRRGITAAIRSPPQLRTRRDLLVTPPGASRPASGLRRRRTGTPTSAAPRTYRCRRSCPGRHGGARDHHQRDQVLLTWVRGARERRLVPRDQLAIALVGVGGGGVAEPAVEGPDRRPSRHRARDPLSQARRVRRDRARLSLSRNERPPRSK